jgi:serine/threonine-protein kinase
MTENYPKQIGRYQVLGELGRGGFGRVYRGYDPTVGRPVALKVLTDVSGDMLTRFRNEAKVAGNLRHNSIVTVYEYGTHDSAPFLAMEYLEGEDLHHVIATRRPLSLLEKCDIMSQVADGLQYAHNNGVVHRDMKPANIMLLHDGAVKIMDFGIARLTRTPDATRLTQQGYLVGTLRYMAPEQLANAEFDARSDIFAYGVIFYELLTGRHPFEAADAQKLMYRLSFEDPAPIAELAPDVPDSLQQVVLRMVHKDRDRRYQSMSEIRLDTEPVRIELQKARASQLLLQARTLLDQKTAEPAQKVLQEALQLDPANTTARELWEKVQQNLQLRSLKPRIEGLLSTAEEHLTNRRFADAVQAFNSALALDPRNTYIRGRIEEARKLVDHAGKASQLLAEARREFEHQNLTAAYRIVSEALRHDPKNPEASEFLKTIESYAEQRQAEQRVDDAIRKAQGLMLIPDHYEAIAVLKASDQNSPKIQEWLEWVRGEKTVYERKQKFRTEMTAATDLLRSSKFDEAARRLEPLQKEFPENREVSDLLAYAQREQAALVRARAVEQAAAEAGECARLKNFERALAVLDPALKKYPGERSLVTLLSSLMAEKTAWERQLTIQAAIDRCESLRSQQKFEEAGEAVRTALVENSADPRLVALARQIEDEWSQGRRNEFVRKASERVEQLLAQMQLEAALETIHEALKHYPSDIALDKLLKHTRNQVLIRDKARVAERAAAIDQCAQEARTRAAAGDFEGGRLLLEDGLQKWPDAGSLKELRDSILAERDRFARRARNLQELRQIRHSALHAPLTLATEETLALVSSISSEYPRDQEIQSIGAELIALLSDIGRARRLVRDGKFQAALEVCTRRLTQNPNHAAFLELKREAERGQRQTWLRDLESRAASEPDLNKRARILEKGLEQYPNETTIADELRITRNKLALVESIIEKAHACERSGNWEQALEKWNSLLTVYPQYPGLNAEIERVSQGPKKANSQTVVSVSEGRKRVASVKMPRPGIRSLIAGSAAAASLAGGIIAFRDRRPDEITVTFSANVPGTRISIGHISCTTPNCSLKMSPGTYTLRAESTGRTPVDRQFTLASGQAAAELEIVLQPVPQLPEPPSVVENRPEAKPLAAEVTPGPSRVEVSGAMAGVLVIVDGQPIGETDRHGSLSHDLAPGTHTIEFTREDYVPLRITEQFRSGKPLKLDRARVAMSLVPKSAPVADPKQIDAQDWAQVANSTSPEDLDSFIRNHPGSTHLEQARSRTAELRLQARSRAAQQLDQATWDKVDQKSRQQLEDYLSHFPAGIHAQEAHTRIADADRLAIEELAAQRSREQKDQEQKKRAADQQAIVKVLAEFEAAYNRRDLAALQRIWSAVPVTTYRQQFRDARDLIFQLHVIGQPEVSGNSAAAICSRMMSYRGQSGGLQTHSDRVKVSLSREASGWVLRSIDQN